MSFTRLVAVLLMLGTTLIVAACSRVFVEGAEQVIKSTKSGDLTVTLSNATGVLNQGEKDLFISFADASGKPIDIGAASLAFQMAAMGAMPEMSSKAILTTTELPGKYLAKVDLEMSGTWEAVISYEGQHGNGQVRMTVNVK